MATTSHQDEPGEESPEESDGKKGPRPPWWWSGAVQIICVVLPAGGVELLLQIVERLAS